MAKTFYQACRRVLRQKPSGKDERGKVEGGLSDERALCRSFSPSCLWGFFGSCNARVNLDSTYLLNERRCTQTVQPSLYTRRMVLFEKFFIQCFLTNNNNWTRLMQLFFWCSKDLFQNNYFTRSLVNLWRITCY